MTDGIIIAIFKDKAFKNILSPCDELESRLTRSQADSERLIRAVVSGLIWGITIVHGFQGTHIHIWRKPYVCATSTGASVDTDATDTHRYKRSMNADSRLTNLRLSAANILVIP